MNYIISKERLLELLKAEGRLCVLEQDGVDNWEWYMEGRDQYLRDGAEMYGVHLNDGEDFGFDELAELALQDYQEV